MYIESFHIDGFGIFYDVACKGLHPGLTIFYGKNEAGKSTCLEFIRTMLTGYPERKGKYFHEPLRGGQPGGSLVLRSEREPHLIRLMRSPVAHGGLRLIDENGGTVHSEILEKIFGHIDREAYRRVFGFTLYELQQWDKKSEESIRNALYGASFGPGLAAPGTARKELISRMEKIYKPRGNSQPLNQYLAESGKLTAQIDKWENESANYDSLADSIARAAQELDELKARKAKMEDSRRDIERRLDQWKNWTQWRNLGMRIERIGDIPAQLPENALTHLRKLQDECSSVAKTISNVSGRLRLTQENFDSIPLDTSLLNVLEELRRLAENRRGFREARESLLLLQETRTASEKELADNLAQLGPGWDCERIRATDRSIFAKDGIEKRAEALKEASLAHQADLGALETVTNDIQETRSKIEALESDLHALPEISAALTERERDELRDNMTRLEANRKNAPGRERALETAVSTFKRAVTDTRILTADDESASEALNNILGHQDEITALADEILVKIDEQDKSAARVATRENEASALRDQIEVVKSRQKKAAVGTREALESRTAALRSLRSLGAKLESAEAKRDELEDRIRQEGEPTRIRNWMLIIFAVAFLCISGAIMGAYWLFGLREYAVTPELILPINLWGAYAALICGLILLASGLSGNLPEHKRRKQEYARLLASRESSAALLNELTAQANELSREAGLDDYDPISLDAMEMLLEREKEQLYHDERTRDEIEELSAKLDQEIAAIAALKKEYQQKENEVQQLRRRWHSLMQLLHVDNVPSPEGIATIFERANNARVAEANVRSAREELDALWEDFHLIEKSITSLPPIKEMLEASNGALSLEDAVRQTLESCREADSIRDSRDRLLREMDIEKAGLQRQLAKQQNLSDRKNESLHKLDVARNEWSAATDSLGLSEDMNPETVRTAYKYMDNALHAEEEVKKTQRNLDQANREIRAFEEALEKIGKTCDLAPIRNGNGEIDWLASQDDWLRRAEENRMRQERRAEIAKSIENQKEELGGLEAAKDHAEKALQSFLTASDASSAEDLERLVNIRAERRTLIERREELEDSLANVAKEMPLQQFLDSFADTDEESLEKQLREIRATVNELNEREEALVGDQAILSQRKADIEACKEPAIWRQRRAALETEVKRLASEWSSLALAEAMLKEARMIFEKERQPEIIKAASNIFAQITNGKWKGISLNLENSSLVILPPDGEPVPPEALSRGAQEQAYLALRLAYIENHAKSFESLPVIMDEILVNFDPDRARRCAETFAKMTETGNQQILYFTCQPHVVEMLQDYSREAEVYAVEDGTIRPA